MKELWVRLLVRGYRDYVGEAVGYVTRGRVKEPMRCARARGYGCAWTAGCVVKAMLVSGYVLSEIARCTSPMDWARVYDVGGIDPRDIAKEARHVRLVREIRKSYRVFVREVMR
ncbi:unnamed protein product [Dovyalis caffra]|uniref:Uncharacterized protein n=1 Tax=Dovyalis caffra TaxID=77055 RepID=A0AAV1RDW5_9ROSI|nr:unnamed protein product [Dovyalis caffra]